MKLNGKSRFPTLVSVLWFILLFFAGGWPRCVAEEVLYEQKIRAWPFAIIVPVVVDGIRVPMILDSGTRGPGFDISMKAHLGRDLGGTMLSGFGGEVKSRLYATLAMTLGSWVLSPAKASVIDQRPRSARDGLNVDGL